MSDFSDMAELFKRLGIGFEEKVFTVRQNIVLTAECQSNVFGSVGGFVQFSFMSDEEGGGFCCAGIYPSASGGVVKGPVSFETPAPAVLPKKTISGNMHRYPEDDLFGQKDASSEVDSKRGDDQEDPNLEDKIISGKGLRKTKTISPPPIKPKTKINYAALAEGLDESLREKNDLTTLFAEYKKEKK